MRILSISLILLLCFIHNTIESQQKIQLKPLESKRVYVKEPSDICLTVEKDGYFIVSDDGMLVRTDLNFRPLQVSGEELYDAEAVYADNDYVYVVEERTRNLLTFDRVTLNLVGRLNFPYQGGRNKGYESFTFNEAKKNYVLITEKEPIWIFELNEMFVCINQIEFNYKGDISAATYYRAYLWFLSDENSEVLKVNPLNYTIEKIYRIPVINPEGLVFLPDDRLLVVSDDMQKAYYFKLNDSK